MNNTRYLKILLAVSVAALMLTGCKKEPAQPAQTPAADTSVDTDSTQTETTQIANPMEEVDNAQAFNDKLGIYIDTAQLGADPKLFIYNGEMAEVQYTAPGMGDEDLEIRLRASKNTEEDISGVYDDKMQDVESNYGDMNINHRYSPETGTEIFDLEKDGTHYCITISGEASQMQIAEIMDNSLLACGYK